MVLTEHCEAMACKCFSRSLNFCEGVTGGFPSKGPVIQSFDVFVGDTLHKLLNKHSSSQWNEAHIVTWRHCYALNGFAYKGGVMISFSVNSNSSPGLCVPDGQTFVTALTWYWQGLSHVRTGGNCIENVDTIGFTGKIFGIICQHLLVLLHIYISYFLSIFAWNSTNHESICCLSTHRTTNCCLAQAPWLAW